ncbi:gamma carbonic anhydrase family protein [Natrialbaceae archaeon A-CW1-1]
MLRSFDGHKPTIAESAYVDETAVIIGNVVLDSESSIWPGAVLRGDHGQIIVREGANIQDNATVHESVEIGSYATVGHNAIVHNATIGRKSVVGMGAVVLDNSKIGEGSIVAANSVVTENNHVPEGVLVAGSPAKVIKNIDSGYWQNAGKRYVERAKRYKECSEIIE